MARDNFISDNLIDIRERLRKDQNVQNVQNDNTPAVQAPVQTAEPQQKVSYELPAPAPRMQLRNPELDRERRELTGRIRRDYTLVAAELENMEKKKAEAISFMDFLSNHQKALEGLDFDKSDISRELDRLTWEYYQRSGRWRAFSNGEHSTAETNEPVHQTVPAGGKFTAVAIIISAIMISATILAVFL